MQELATHAPMMIRVPGLTDKGMRSMAYTEHIDLFPTLAEIAAVHAPSSRLTNDIVYEYIIYKGARL